jgi:hypothetical protein
MPSRDPVAHRIATALHGQVLCAPCLTLKTEIPPALVLAALADLATAIHLTSELRCTGCGGDTPTYSLVVE